MRTGRLVARACMPLVPVLALAACLDIPNTVSDVADGSSPSMEGSVAGDGGSDQTAPGDGSGPGVDSSAPVDSALPGADVVIEASCSPNLQTDPANCGRCGHACESGQSCAASVCAPHTLRTGNGAISGLRLLGGMLYWLEGGAALYACAAPACASPVAVVTSDPGILGFAVAGTTAYTVEGASIDARWVRSYSTTTAGSSPTDVTWTSGLYGLAAPVDVDATEVWFLPWPNGGPQAFGAVNQTDVSASSFSHVVTSDIGNAVLLRVAVLSGNEYAFWTEGGRLVRVPTVDGATTTTMATGMGITGLALDSASVFWTDEVLGTVQSCPVLSGDCSSATLLRGGQDVPSRIAVDPSGVAWTNAGSSASNGTVVECSYPACSEGPFNLAIDQATPHEIALDSTYVYWAAGSSLYSVTR